MSRLKVAFGLALAVVLSGFFASASHAQVFVYGRPAIAPIVPPIVMPRRYPLVTTYRAPLAYVAPPVAYSTVTPTVTASVYSPVAVVATARVRPAVVGPGIGGLPNVYVPGQPIRNALRFAIP